MDTATTSFLEWLLVNVSAESNWPGYKSPLSSGALVGDDTEVDGRSSEHNQDDGDEALLALDQEHWQLQNTLDALEQELADLKILETHAIDANKALDVDIHHTSVKLDATVLKIEETARTVFSEYFAPTHSTSPAGSRGGMNGGMNAITDNTSMAVHRRRGGSHGASSSSASPRKQFLYQCQDDLLQIQQLDKEFLANIDLLHKYILDSIDLSASTQRAQTTTTTIITTSSSPSSHLEQILRRDPVQEKELVRLCSTYRATKMSHIRAMAQLKCLEDELIYMKKLDAELEQEDLARDQEDDDRTQDYSIADIRTQQTQKLRQQEIELISVQRETARLMEEMEQLLSDPAPHESGPSGGASGPGAEIEAHQGVLVDICERIARSDIELRYLTTAHRDFIRQQEQAKRRLETMVDQILEYYCLGVLVEQVLCTEKNAVQHQKHVLWAAIEECQEHLQQSKRISRTAEASSAGRKLNHRAGTGSELGKNADEDPQAQLWTLFEQNEHLKAERDRELVEMQQHITQLMNVREHMDSQLLHQHSSTDEVQFVPRNIHVLQNRVTERTAALQQEYSELSGQVQEILRSKQRTVCQK
ncbi:hypothetical protein BGZ70_010539 [Mortierella alpina]|uniref:Uncharacterized protein n=1 Tax=Mortierella alpina TaxID=64518 RepID=A0A9P6LZM6_MORAP|nr:hypothetical protein BGZ70_010539 [Mortierella alpina]